MKKGIRESTGLMLVVLFFFVFGLSAGAFTEVLMGSEIHSEIAVYIQRFFEGQGTAQSSSQIFLNSLKTNGLLLAIMAVGGVTVVGFPLALGVLAFKGASLGFTFALIMETLGVKGVWSSVVSMLLQNMILIPVFLLFCFFTLHLSFGVLFCREKHHRKRIYQNSLLLYITCFFGSALVLLAGCFVEAYLSPVLMGII